MTTRGRPKNRFSTSPATFYLTAVLRRRIAEVAIKQGTDRSRVVRDALKFALKAGPESWT